MSKTDVKKNPISWLLTGFKKEVSFFFCYVSFILIGLVSIQTPLSL